ncbi:hypothetical protein CR513_21339, partial [Mucuna pruriens]
MDFPLAQRKLDKSSEIRCDHQGFLMRMRVSWTMQEQRESSHKYKTPSISQGFIMYVTLLGNVALRDRLIWCFMHLKGGNPRDVVLAIKHKLVSSSSSSKDDRSRSSQVDMSVNAKVEALSKMEEPMGPFIHESERRYNEEEGFHSGSSRSRRGGGGGRRDREACTRR